MSIRCRGRPLHRRGVPVALTGEFFDAAHLWWLQPFEGFGVRRSEHQQLLDPGLGVTGVSQSMLSRLPLGCSRVLRSTRRTATLCAAQSRRQSALAACNRSMSPGTVGAADRQLATARRSATTCRA